MSANDAAQSKRRSWITRVARPSSSSGRSGGSERPSSSGGRFGGGGGWFPGSSTSDKAEREPLPTPQEGQVLDLASPAASVRSIPLPDEPRRPATSSGGVPFTRSETLDSPHSSRPSTPKRWSLRSSGQQLEQDGSVINGLERTTSTPLSSSTSSSKTSDTNARNTGSLSKMSFSSIIGLSSLSLSRTSTNNSSTNVSGPSDENDKGKEKESKEPRGRTMDKDKANATRSCSAVAAEKSVSRSRSRARSQSPFSFRRFRRRETSPPLQPVPLAVSDLDVSDTSSIRPRHSAYDVRDGDGDDDSGDETIGETDAETEEESWSETDLFDTVTERNTEQNSIITPMAHPDNNPTLVDDADVDPDPTGEGVNIVVPPEPYFPTTLNSTPSVRGKRNPRRRKSTRHHDPLPSTTSRPVFQRDRCTITIVQGDPEAKLAQIGRRCKRYVVASDMSEESRYAVEWGIGTVLRDGDEMWVVNVVETDSKIDPLIPNAADRALKVKSQQERQAFAYILARQVNSLLSRTKLNVTIHCQAWHAKNARHMLLDVIDHYEPTMLIVGSRGMSHLKGILLGSTSHYLIQKSSVPVMVARRRLKRAPKRSAHLAKHRAHVSLAEAGIDRVAAKVDHDVQVMRDEMQREEANHDRNGHRVIEEDPEDAEVEEDDIEGDIISSKVAG
ncbi:hypothetical protein EYR40_009526 [Pleurotus pulmonarius]|nr:hypothetical protein EYR38_009373 [Pleurotus pulmonarius]KAF4590929.1 hypothetical protein EYR40_009526 [Pleurotus pulmonarius]